MTTLCLQVDVSDWTKGEREEMLPLDSQEVGVKENLLPLDLSQHNHHHHHHFYHHHHHHHHHQEEGEILLRRKTSCSLDELREVKWLQDTVIR